MPEQFRVGQKLKHIVTGIIIQCLQNFEKNAICLHNSPVLPYVPYAYQVWDTCKINSVLS